MEAGGDTARSGDRRTERDAVLAVRSGDRNAFGRLVVLHQKRLFSLAMMMLRDAAAAEDIAQEAFVRAYTYLDRYDAERPFYPWLAAIAVRLAQSWMRSHGRAIEREDPESDPKAEPAATDDPLDTLITDESGRKLWDAVEALPAAQRTAVFLFYRQDMKLTDVATALGVTNGTVKTLLFRARQALRAAIGAENQESHP